MRREVRLRLVRYLAEILHVLTDGVNEVKRFLEKIYLSLVPGNFHEGLYQPEIISVRTI